MQNETKNDRDPWSTIHVRRAITEDDMQHVYEMRWQGYRKYFDDSARVKEALDLGDNAVLLLATRPDMTPIGTLRILDRRYGPIELDSFLDITELLPIERFPVAEATRISVPTCSDSQWIKLALWKAYYRYCVHENLRTMLISGRRGTSRDYKELLMFEHLGDKGIYSHRLLRSRLHETYAFDVPTGAARYEAAHHPLFHFFCTQEHPNISFV